MASKLIKFYIFSNFVSGWGPFLILSAVKMRNILTVIREHLNEQKTPKDYGWVGFISDFDERQYAKKAFKLELVTLR